MKQFSFRQKFSFLLLRLLTALLVAAPVICQSELQPYFSLSSDKTFGSKETPTVFLTGSQVKAVQIRVYRVKDPLEFYRKLEASHNFGSEPPVRAGKRGLLESVRAWKHELRREIRVFLREQFTESVSAHFKRPAAAEKAIVSSHEDYYAATPLLNRDQLVLSFVQPLLAQGNWSSQNVPIRVRENGMYLVEAASGGLRAYTIVVKSDLVVITKVGKQNILGFVADRASGEPVPEATLSVMTRNGTPAVLRTNTDGLAKLDAKPEPGVDDLRVLVRKGDDVTINSLSLWNFGESARSWTGYIYTDRPVYRPGDTVHFRGILRQAQSPGGYTIPAQQSLAVQIQDPDGKSVYAQHLTTNTNGIIHGEFVADRTAALGNYYLQVAGGESSMTGTFEVQEYKKPEYEVRVTPAEARVLQGNKLDFTINARYYFGEPVKGAKVEYSIYRSGYYYPFWRDADEEDPDSDPAGDNQQDGNNDEAGEEVLKTQAQLDDNGNLRVSYNTTVSDNHHDYRYRIEARVTDEARREISGTGWVIAAYGTFLVNAEPQRYFYEASGTADLSLKAFDYDGKPVSTPVRVSLLRSVPGGKRGALTFTWTTVNTLNAATGPDGAGSLSFPLPAQGGSYRIRISAQSGNNRIVENFAYLWIAGTGENNFFGSTATRTLQIVPDKKKYRAGETAKLLLITGKPNTPVLVTVEGRDVLLSKVLRSNTSTVSFNYPVNADDEPGFFVTAQLLCKGELSEGQKRVAVPPEHHRLNVQIATDKPQYEPGQTAVYRLKVTTPDGKPVRGADLSLGVVDEAIYAIRPDASPDLLRFFYGNQGNNVSTLNSLTYYFSGEAGNRRMMLADAPPPAPRVLAQLKREPLVQPKIRKLFPDTSFWAADLTTDQSGSVQTKVSFPDSLTTWRSTVKGATVTNRFGGAVMKTVVRKNFIMRLSVPRFFVKGDETVISGIVHNYLATPKHARVSVELAGLDLLTNNATQEVDVPSHGEARVDWRVKATGAQAGITGKALTDEESDALEVSLPIHPQGISIRQSKGGSIAAGASLNQQITFAPDAEAGSRSISIRLASSAAGSIFNALDFLTSFPYGCTEQTMSSFLPDLMVTKAMRDLNGVPPVDQADLDKKVKAGLNRLFEMQHEDGGWGWWPSDNSYPFMTAYVVAGLAEAKNNGVEVNEQSLQKGMAWLRTELAKQSDLAPDMQAYAAYALALAGAPDSVANTTYSQRAKLSPYGKALLGLAFELAKDNRASSLAAELEQSVTQTNAEAWWTANRDEMLDFDADVSPEATAYAVKLLTHQRKNSPLLPKAVLWLVNHRNEGFWWSSTKQTAMVIYGLLDYLKAGNELAPDFTATINVNGQTIATQKFATGSPVNAPEILLDESKLQPGSNQISITTSGSGRLYYSLAGIHYSNAARLEKQGAVSLNVLRDYFRLVPAAEGDHTVYNLAPLNGPVASGDILVSRLTVTGSDWRYLLAEDPIPAGTEFIERDNLYQLRNRPPWWQYYFSRRELHDDRMAIFQTYFNQGQQQYFYLLKVVNPGLFHASPARVQPMYQPGIEATTETKIVEVKQQ